MHGRTSLRGRARFGRFTVGALTILCVSCAAVGPKTISRDQFDYGAAIGNSAREQLLTNIVGLRYLDAPLFVNVVSVINQYSLEGEANIGVGASTSISGGDTLSLGGAGRWWDRPTITYSPITGREFATSLLTPLPPESLFALVQSGWSAEFLFRMTVKSMNGIENAVASPVGRSQADPRFIEMLRTWSRLRRARALGLRRDRVGEGASRILVFQSEKHPDAEVRKDIDFLHEALELDPDAKEYTLAYGLIRNKANEIVVLTSSILELMNELAWRVEAPPEHIEDGRTMGGFVDDLPGTEPLIRILHSKERPESTYVAIEKRGYWFYIDDRDLRSKRTFALLQVMLSLTDSGDAAKGPVVTIGGS